MLRWTIFSANGLAVSSRNIDIVGVERVPTLRHKLSDFSTLMASFVCCLSSKI